MNRRMREQECIKCLIPNMHMRLPTLLSTFSNQGIKELCYTEVKITTGGVLLLTWTK